MGILSYFSLEGKKVVITGGASGIGKATAKLFAEAGADIAIADINFQDAKKVADEICDLGRKSIAVEVDVVRPETVENMVKKVVSSFQGIDVLVNSAGINIKIPAEDFSEADWDAVININLKGTFLCCKYVGREMIKQQRGNIINLASMCGMIAIKDRTISAYTSSKGGVIMLTKSLAVEWAKHNIRVNALAPGYIKTPFNSWMKDPKVCKSALELVPMQRFAEISEIAPNALFLASKASSYVTGAILTVDGGYTCY